MIGLRPLPQGTTLWQPSTFLATWLGSGLIKPASGTWGTLASMPFVMAIFLLPAALHAFALIVFAVMTFITGLWAAREYMAISKTHDASEIVIDETCGLGISFFILLLYNDMSSTQFITYSIIIFGLFRFYDALKPWPINWLDRHLPGAMGVMIDDCVAGLFTCLTFWGGMTLWAQLV